ncbi:MAG: hypothetical protein AVDCRST_MAG96-4199 [uncultured Segetibacter sp.]|uniref:Uncharacterized protein n=1 Tax=uncultured Segetibacter sp. TaxID=481133 RepID=A0A6J4U3G5_9BACT|nr:MAG: hypothetical protein AVDCRST_MAG96-4199 [uncultured Segetibacter sp.]
MSYEWWASAANGDLVCFTIASEIMKSEVSVGKAGIKK